MEVYLGGLAVLALVLAGIGFNFYLKNKKQALALEDITTSLENLQVEKNTLTTQEALLTADLQNKEQNLTQTKLELDQLKQDFITLQETAAQAKTQLSLKEAEFIHWKNRAEDLEVNFSKVQESNKDLEIAYGSLKTQLAERQEDFKKQQEQLKHEFNQLAQDILKEKTQVFKKESEQSITQLLNPIHQEVKAFKSQVETIQKTETEQRLAIKFELENLQKQNLNLSDQAKELTNALKGQQKAQGNWGELVLQRVLETAGLEEPRDFVRELNLKTEEGQNRRPDVVINLPNDRHLIIDAKTSLIAFNRFINSEDAQEREVALKEHLTSLRTHMKDLSSKEYYRLQNITAPEVVVLFVPIEAAYVEAIKHDPKLLEEAMAMNLLIATPSTLLSSLQLIRQLWRFAEQSKHSKALADRAELFYGKLAGFVESMQEIDKSLDRAKTTYDKAFSQLYTGRGNLIKQASDFKDLGVSVKKELAQDLVEKASLELVGDQVLTLEAKEKSSEQEE